MVARFDIRFIIRMNNVLQTIAVLETAILGRRLGLPLDLRTIDEPRATRGRQHGILLLGSQSPYLGSPRQARKLTAALSCWPINWTCNIPNQPKIIDPAKTAMVVVNMQNDFVAKGATFHSRQAA
jgi:hypothetical protein